MGFIFRGVSLCEEDGMKSIQVKELMVPLAQYATVSEDATLYEAVVALKAAQECLDPSRHKHRAILVYDAKKRIVGKLSQLDVLKSLEPKYEDIGKLDAISRFGFSREFVSSMLKNYGLWEKPLQDLCKKAAQKKVKDIMYTPGKGEYISDEDSLDAAIHQLIMGQHQSLLVTHGEEIVGVLRLTDVFEAVCDAMKACAL